MKKKIIQCVESDACFSTKLYHIRHEDHWIRVVKYAKQVSGNLQQNVQS